MKKKVLPVLATLIVGVLYILAPRYFFPVCELTRERFEKVELESLGENLGPQVGHSHNQGAAAQPGAEFMVPKLRLSDRVSDSTHMACYYTAKAELGLGLLILLGALIRLMVKTNEAQIAIDLTMAGCAVLGALWPTVLIGLCSNPSMPCRIGTLPALIVLSSLFFIYNIVLIILHKKR